MRPASILALALAAFLIAGVAQEETDTRKVVHARVILEEIERGEPVDYDGVIVVGDLDLRGRTLGKVHFINTTFKGFVDLRDTNFTGEVSFEGANFSGKDFYGKCADFSFAKFPGGDAYFLFANFSGGDVNFSKAEFSGGHSIFCGANFSGGEALFPFTKFSGGCADFQDAKFSGGDAQFSFAKFSGGDAYYSFADFSNAMFSGGDAHFSFANFKEPAIFTGSTFERNTSFEYARFGDRVSFAEATFNGYTDFYETQFSGNAYFRESSFNENLNLTRTGYIRFFLPWSSVDNHQLRFSDDDAYLYLIRNYVNLGWFEDSNSCYYEYRDRHRISEPVSFEKATDYLEWIFYGYGVKPLRTTGWIFFLILIFGLVFRNVGSIKKYIIEEREEILAHEPTEDLKSEAVEIKTVLKREDISFIDPFLFSLTTFTSGFTSFLYPSIEFRAEKHKRLVILERLLGSVFLALLITAISKTYLIR